MTKGKWKSQQPTVPKTVANLVFPSASQFATTQHTLGLFLFVFSFGGRSNKKIVLRVLISPI